MVTQSPRWAEGFLSSATCPGHHDTHIPGEVAEGSSPQAPLIHCAEPEVEISLAGNVGMVSSRTSLSSLLSGLCLLRSAEGVSLIVCPEAG